MISKLKMLLASAALCAGAAAAPTALAQSQPYVGQITPTIGSFCPRGWELAAGQLIAISQNDALFSLYGTMYGGDGRTTFGLPDLRGRMAMGQGQGNGLTLRNQGSMVGSDTVTLIISNLASHTHTMGSSSASPTMPGISGAVLATFPANIPAYAPGSPLPQTLNPASVGRAGGNQPVNIQQPFAAVNYCVAMYGIFPSRN